MKYKLGLTLAMASVAGFAFVGPGQAGPEFKNKYENDRRVHDCPNTDNTIEFVGPEKLWPPNHKMQGMSIEAIDRDTDPDDEVSLTVTLGDITDATGGDGGVRHDPDFAVTGMNPATGNPVAMVPFELRSERSGRGEGRTYTLNATATYGTVLGAVVTCSAAFEVLVPHDMRGGADWK